MNILKLKEDLQELIKLREFDAPALWKKGKKTESVLLDCNIDRAKHFVKTDNLRMIRKMINVLEE